MDKTQQNKLYEEYCQSMRPQPTKETLQRNLAKFKQEHRQATLESGKHFIEYRHKDYDRKLAENALNQCKSKQEWRDMEADDQRPKATGIMTQRSAEELMERCVNKANISYNAEQWFMNQIKLCEEALAEITDANISERKKHNKIKHWKERRTEYLVKLDVQIHKTHRFEALATKWRGIFEQIKTAAIAREIAAERAGHGNKYGFNPNMQSRATATGIFTDD